MDISAVYYAKFSTFSDRAAGSASCQLQWYDVQILRLNIVRFARITQSKWDIIELSFNSNEFGREFLTKPSMFGKLEVHASEVVWRFEPITFYIGSLRVKLISDNEEQMSPTYVFCGFLIWTSTQTCVEIVLHKSNICICKT